MLAQRPTIYLLIQLSFQRLKQSVPLDVRPCGPVYLFIYFFAGLTCCGFWDLAVLALASRSQLRSRAEAPVWATFANLTVPAVQSSPQSTVPLVSTGGAAAAAAAAALGDHHQVFLACVQHRRHCVHSGPVQNWTGRIFLERILNLSRNVDKHGKVRL